MKIRVRDIKSEGLALAQDISAEEIGLVTEDYIKVKGPIRIEGLAEKAQDTVLVKVKIDGAFETFCARCLEPIQKSLQKELFFDFHVQANTEYIEIDDDIRQELLLNSPLKILCREDCKGLCTGCGANLNTEKCKCKK